ncbi:MAG: hypothetical protein IH977_06800 [Nitrospinae bacterium]|nr:hypothetical protein [Nitrospinota bacterium]
MGRPLLIENCHRRLDLRQLVQARLLVPNTRFAWCWRDHEGRSLGEMGVSVKIDHLVLGYEVNTQEGLRRFNERITLTRTPTRFGGHRQWLCCPGCQHRAVVLYAIQEVFRCRKCQGLRYQTQYPPRNRSYARKHRILGRG